MAARAHDMGSHLAPYLNDIRVFSLIDPEQEVTLARRLRNARKVLDVLGKLPDHPRKEKRVRVWTRRYETAREEFIQANLSLVIHLAKKYQYSGLSLNDLIQEGNLGLMRAVEKFNPELGNKFSTYACWWIHHMLRLAVAHKTRMIRIPIHMQDRRKQVIRVRHEVARKLDREVGPVDIAQRMKISVKKIEEAMDLVNDPIFLEDLASEDGPRPVEIIPDDNSPSPLEAIKDEQVKSKLQLEMREILGERNEAIMCLRYGLGNDRVHTLDEIGQIMDLSRERIRQVEAESLKKLRDSNLLKELLALVTEE